MNYTACTMVVTICAIRFASTPPLHGITNSYGLTCMLINTVHRSSVYLHTSVSPSILKGTETGRNCSGGMGCQISDLSTAEE